MKKFASFGMLAMMSIFILINCNNDGGEQYEGPKTIKITGYEGGVTAYSMEIYAESAGIDSWPPAAEAIQVIDAQTITYPLEGWKSGGATTGESWTGSGFFFIIIECNPPKDLSKDGAKYAYSENGINATPVEIKNGVTTLQWSKFIWLKDFTAG